MKTDNSNSDCDRIERQLVLLKGVRETNVEITKHLEETLAMELPKATRQELLNIQEYKENHRVALRRHIEFKEGELNVCEGLSNTTLFNHTGNPGMISWMQPVHLLLGLKAHPINSGVAPHQMMFGYQSKQVDAKIVASMLDGQNAKQLLMGVKPKQIRKADDPRKLSRVKRPTVRCLPMKNMQPSVESNGLKVVMLTQKPSKEVVNVVPIKYKQPLQIKEKVDHQSRTKHEK